MRVQPEGLVERLHALNGRVQMTRADAIGVGPTFWKS